MAETVKKYRPANGSEGADFMSRWCDKCEHDVVSACPLIAATMCFEADDHRYPTAWTFDGDGKPCCTAFEPTDEPSDKAAERAGQENLFAGVREEPKT